MTAAWTCSGAGFDMAAHCKRPAATGHNRPVPEFDTTMLVLLAGAVVAGFVQGLAGFAFSLTATSIWIWWLPPQLIAVMSVVGALTGQLIAAFSTRRMQR